VTIFYHGFLLDGTEFDGTGEEPATFRLDQLIVGWQIGIPMFGKGGKGKLIIPPGLAYGPNDNGQIPGNSTLMFEIELIDWKKAQKQQMFW
jgi:FKBP-type peptidyl-prolyl cis-trans isomerase FkpA